MKTFLSRKPRQETLWVVLVSMLLLIGIFLLDMKNIFHVQDVLSADSDAIIERHQYWRLFTEMFVHVNVRHLASNLVPFAFFSYLLYGYFGPTAFPVLPLLIMPFANLLRTYTYSESQNVLGSSGMVYFMGAFWFTLYCLIERNQSFRKRFLVCGAAALYGFLPGLHYEHTAYRAHFIGAVFGILTGLLYFEKNLEAFTKVG